MDNAVFEGFFDEMEKNAGLKTKALKFLAGYLIAKSLLGKLKKKDGMSPKEMQAMQAGMQIGLNAGRKEVRALQADTSGFQRQMMEMGKHAGLGMDLRMNGPGGVKRPPFPTEGSKGLAFKNFKQSRKIGQTMSVKPPTPNIRSVASISR